jgi:hypothetical protein
MLGTAKLILWHLLETHLLYMSVTIAQRQTYNIMYVEQTTAILSNTHTLVRYYHHIHPLQVLISSMQ